jgi:predicted nucleotidyltransferase
MTMKLQVNQDALAGFCREHGIARLELFGSALREDFRGDSDVDLLCTLRPDVKCGLFEWAALKIELEKVLGRPVGLVSRWGIERSKNRCRKHAILSTAVPIYEEG